MKPRRFSDVNITKELVKSGYVGLMFLLMSNHSIYFFRPTVAVASSPVGFVMMMSLITHFLGMSLH